MIKYYIGQFFRLLGWISLPGLLINICRTFFLDKKLEIGIDSWQDTNSFFSLNSLAYNYMGISLFLCPIAFAVYLLIRRSIYNKHWDEAYAKQTRGTHSKDHSLWDDSHWDKS